MKRLVLMLLVCAAGLSACDGVRPTEPSAQGQARRVLASADTGWARLSSGGGIGSGHRADGAFVAEDSTEAGTGK